MTVRGVPYPHAGCPLRVPSTLWSRALRIVRAYQTLGAEGQQRGSEALVYLAGVPAGSQMVVTGLYLLGHSPQGDRVIVKVDEARWLVRTLRERDEKLIAQVHSHRGMAGHSPGDDMHATSFHEGFLSVVVPRFGVGIELPPDCAVYEYRSGDFVELSLAEVRERVRVYDEVVERSPVPKEARWIAFGRRLRSIARKLPLRRAH